MEKREQKIVVAKMFPCYLSDEYKEMCKKDVAREIGERLLERGFISFNEEEIDNKFFDEVNPYRKYLELSGKISVLVEENDLESRKRDYWESVWRKDDE